MDWVELAPLSVLPSQFVEARPRSPEQRLCLAILEDALRCLQRHPPTDRIDREREEAWAWFASDAAYPFSFVDVCFWLELNPTRLRALELERVKMGHRTVGKLFPIVSHRERAA